MEGIKLYKNKFRIKSARRECWDYSQAGHYFVTICAKNRELFFGNVVSEWEEAEMKLSDAGKIACDEWIKTPKIRKNVILDEFIIMPNHIHGIIIINEQIVKNLQTTDVETHCNASLRMRNTPPNDEYKNKFGPQSNNLSAIIRGFKGAVTNTINQKYPKNNFAWQTRFHDRIIRNKFELNNVKNYILNNPLKWHLDRNNSENLFM